MDGSAVVGWRVVGAGLWVGAVLVPLVGLLIALATGPGPQAGWWFTSRQLVLLGKTAGLAGVATVVTFLVALPTVRGLGWVGGRGRDRWVWLILGLALLLPPYVYAFGWDGLIAPRLTAWLGSWAGMVRTVWVWAGWSWPIPALFLTAGWVRVGHGAYRAALLEANPRTAFRRAVLPILAGHGAAAMVVLWVLFMIEYNVPHACSIQVFATELLAWGQSSRHAVDVVYPAVPLLVVMVAAGGCGLIVWRGSAGGDDQQDPPPAEVGVGRWRSLWPVVAVLALTMGTPFCGLAVRLASWTSFVALWQVYGGELAESIAIAAASGVAVVWLGTWLAGEDRWVRVRGAATVTTILFGLMPAGLVGEAMVVAYRHVGVIYDQWPVMVLTQTARWGWIGWVAGWLIKRSTPTGLIDQARTDGAGRAAAGMMIGWRHHWPILAAAAALAAAMCLAEVAAMSMVRPPGVGWMAMTLMEKFHRFEDQMLVTISFVLALAPVPAVVLGWLAWRVRGA